MLFHSSLLRWIYLIPSRMLRLRICIFSCSIREDGLRPLFYSAFPIRMLWLNAFLWKVWSGNLFLRMKGGRIYCLCKRILFKYIYILLCFVRGYKSRSINRICYLSIIDLDISPFFYGEEWLIFVNSLDDWVCNWLLLWCSYWTSCRSERNAS